MISYLKWIGCICMGGIFLIVYFTPDKSGYQIPIMSQEVNSMVEKSCYEILGKEVVAFFIPLGTIISCPKCEKKLYKTVKINTDGISASDFEPIGNTPKPVEGMRTVCPFCGAELWDELHKYLQRFK